MGGYPGVDVQGVGVLEPSLTVFRFWFWEG